MYPFKFSVTVALIFAAFITTAQVGPQPAAIKMNSKDCTMVVVEASYPGGYEAWVKYLQKKLKPDVPVKNEAPSGKYQAMVLFIVDKDGTVSNVKPETRFGYGMEDEVVRVIELSGKWTPATHDGVLVKAYRRQPITFIVDSEYFGIVSKEPYTLFTNTDNEITVTARKVKPEDVSINVQGGKATRLSDGKFLVRVNKVGRINIEVVNNKKDDKILGVASFEVVTK